MKIKEIQRICEDEEEVVPTTVVKVIEFFIDVVGAKRESAKLFDRVNSLKRRLEDAHSVARLACINLEVASVCIKTLEAQVKDADAKYAKLDDKTAQTEKDFCSPISSLESSLKAERARIAQ